MFDPRPPVDPSDRLTADLAFIGHMCLDEVIPFGGSPRVAPGSAVLCGALAAARIGSRIAASLRAIFVTTATFAPMRAAASAPHSTALPAATRGKPPKGVTSSRHICPTKARSAVSSSELIVGVPDSYTIDTGYRRHRP